MIGFLEMIAYHSRYVLILEQHPKLPKQFKIPQYGSSLHIRKSIFEINPCLRPNLRMPLNQPASVALVKYLEETLILIHVCLLH